MRRGLNRLNKSYAHFHLTKPAGATNAIEGALKTAIDIAKGRSHRASLPSLLQKHMLYSMII